MKKIYRIARLELSLLFYSPIAWLVLIIFIIQCGVNFIDLLEAKETNQQLGYDTKALTVSIFGGARGFYAAIQHKLYLYIPLLTMGLMSREISSGSIKLLYSSPITNSQIIYGKFLAMMIYGFMLMLVLLTILLSGVISIEALDVKFVLGGMLGLYMLICAYAAIGLFLSSLTPYQVVAAISTLAVFAALNFVGTIGQSTDFIRDITYWISIEGRANNFINGLLSSKDVIYFLLVIGFFLMLTIMRLNDGRQTRSAAATYTRYSFIVVAVLMIGYVSSLPAFTGYYDTTRFKDRTLTENSQNLLKDLKKPVKITSYVNVINTFAHLGSPRFRLFDLRQFDQYTRFLPDLKIDYIHYYDSTFDQRDNGKPLKERAEQYALAHGFDFEHILSPEEVQKQENLVPELNAFVRFVEYEGKKTPLRMFHDMEGYPKEAEITAALKRLMVDAPVVGVLTGNDERSINKTGDKGYKDITTTLTSRASLNNHGFDFLNIQINEVDTIPQNLAVLIVADPINEYTIDQVQKINRYVEAGGNILVAAEPGKHHILNPISQNFGVTFKPETLIQESKDYDPDLIQACFSDEASENGYNFSSKDIISMSGALSFNYEPQEGFVAKPVLYSYAKFEADEDINLETDKLKAETVTSGTLSISAVKDAGEKTNLKPVRDNSTASTVALAITRQLQDKEQKIMVMGDADFMSNFELKRSNLRTKNYAFTVKVFKWFSNGEFPIDTTRPEAIDNAIKITQAHISWLRTFFSGLLPIAIGLIGANILISRKRK